MRLFTISLFICFIFWHGHAQQASLGSVEVTYVKAYKSLKDTTDTQPKKFWDLEYRLLATPTESRFEYLEAMDSDADRETNRFVTLGGGGKGIYYKNRDKNEFFRGLNEKGNDFLIELPYERFEWELLRETKEIAGYTCYKAKGEYKVYDPLRKKEVTVHATAWYTPEIPWSYGPDGADGLPGLVLETIRSGGAVYLTAEEVKLSEKEKKIKKPTKGKPVTEQEYLKSLVRGIGK